ncbi:MAG: polysaccharide deacetylase family protein [Sphingobacterium sp.]
MANRFLIEMHFIRPFFLLPHLYPEGIWRMDTQQPSIYLTFDDGPVPEVTPWVLDVLNSRGIKATFFCVGENIEKYPDIFERIKFEGHAVGNHTHNHLKGFKIDTEVYLQNVERCQELTGTDLFRPPYGRAKKAQLKQLYRSHRIIYWDVLTGDYDQNITPQACYRNCVDYCRNGSIIVFHDSQKAKRNLYHALPKSIDTLISKGFRFDLF